MKKIRVGIIGLGYWGPNLTRNFHKHPGFEVVWGADISEKNLKKIQSEFPLIKVTKNMRDMLDDPSLELIAVATPPHSHFEIGKSVLLSGKDLWIEKPFTTSLTHAKYLVTLAKKKKRRIHVDYPFIYHGPVRKIKELLEKKAIGTPLFYSSIRSNLGLLQKEIDVIWDLAVHDLSILLYLFPKLTVQKLSVTGSSHISKKHYEIGNLIITGKNNGKNLITAYIQVSWLSPVKIRLTTIGGTDKMILFDDVVPSEKIKIYNKNVKIKRNSVTPFNPVYREGDVWIPTFSQTEALYLEIDSLYKSYLGKHEEIDTPAIALAILEILSKRKSKTSL